MAIPRLYKETNIYKKNAIAEGVEEAGSKAERYITDYTAYGTFLHAEGTVSDPTSSAAYGVLIGNTQATGSAVKIIRAGVAVAEYGSAARIGTADGENVLIDNDSVDIRNGSTVLASFGARTTLGSREQTGAEGTGSFSAGRNNIASGAYSSTRGYNLMASGDCASAEGGYNGTNYDQGFHATDDIAQGDTVFTLTAYSGSTARITFIKSGSWLLSPCGPVLVDSVDEPSNTSLDPTLYITVTLDPSTPITRAIDEQETFFLLTVASGQSSHAEGRFTQASGDYSHAEGNATIASGPYSHAEGSRTKASGDYSHAEGAGTTASCSGSHAEGASTKASGDYSHAEGYYTEAKQHQHVVGKYNTVIAYNSSGPTPLEIVGNGTSSSSRSNARVMYSDGKEVLSGDLFLNGDSKDTAANGVGYKLSHKIDEPATEGTAGQVLTTDGNGGRSWTTVRESMYIAYDGDYPTLFIDE